MGFSLAFKLLIMISFSVVFKIVVYPILFLSAFIKADGQNKPSIIVLF